MFFLIIMTSHSLLPHIYETKIKNALWNVSGFCTVQLKQIHTLKIGSRSMLASMQRELGNRQKMAHAVNMGMISPIYIYRQHGHWIIVIVTGLLLCPTLFPAAHLINHIGQSTRLINHIPASRLNVIIQNMPNCN